MRPIRMNALPPVTGLRLTGNYALAAIPASYAMERGQLKEVSSVRPLAEGEPWSQATLVAGNRGRQCPLLPTRTSRQGRARTLRPLRDAAKPTVLMIQPDRSAAPGERGMDRRRLGQERGCSRASPLRRTSTIRRTSVRRVWIKTPSPQASITPAREMLAELLLAGTQPGEALGEYEAVLKISEALQRRLRCRPVRPPPAAIPPSPTVTLAKY
jgi:hypothetical protein